MRVAVDTNILAYAEGVNGTARREEALALLRDLDPTDLVLPAQAIGELFVVLTRKAGRPPADARSAALAWTDAYEVAATTQAAMLDAMEIASTHRLGLWDAVMIAVAAQAGCRELLTEDMQHGFIWRGVSLRNPFAH